MFSKTASFLPMVTLFSATFLTIQTAAPQTKDAPPQSNAPAPHAKAAAGLELLTDPEGVDFNTCLREIYLSVRKSWYEIMPPSVEKGNQGVNAVQFRILRDGSVPEDSVELTYHSGKEDFDKASLQAVREAAPFNHLPEKFSQPFIALRITFYYNVKPPTP
jgi:TonB family protein